MRMPFAAKEVINQFAQSKEEVMADNECHIRRSLCCDSFTENRPNTLTNSVEMLTNEAFQKLLFDLFCAWHGVQRHYDPPITDTEEERMAKVKKVICKLLTEIDARVSIIRSSSHSWSQELYEEWTMLTWNVLCITSRLQNVMSVSIPSSEDKVIFERLNSALVDLVNFAKVNPDPPITPGFEQDYHALSDLMNNTMSELHQLYKAIKECALLGKFREILHTFMEQKLTPVIDLFKKFCNNNSVHLWSRVRAAQVQRMQDFQSMPDEPVTTLVAFYSHMMYTLAILAARLQGFRYEMFLKDKLYNCSDLVEQISMNVFSALELLMADCVLATEPSTNAILVTNNLFSVNCGALARGVVFKQFDIQVISEETAEHIQSEMRRQKMLQQPSPIGTVPSAALLAMKPTSGTKRGNSVNQTGNTAHKKSDVNSKEIVTIYPVYNSKNKYWAATYPHLLCTTRQKGRHSVNNSFQDLSSSSSIFDSKSNNGKRPIFYLHVKATMFSPSGQFATAHTLSLPFTIATRRNQDCQVQRMMSSYTATCFWLYGNKVQDGLLLQWSDRGMFWEDFKLLYMQHFKVNADVTRGLHDRDFDLLQYKLQCNDCKNPESLLDENAPARYVTFKNVLCPHLRYEWANQNVKFSVWRGMLELLQIFQDHRNNVRKLWEKGLLMGFVGFTQVQELLAQHQSTLIMRLSFVTGGTICFTLKSNAHSLQQNADAYIHLEPLDLKKLQAKCLTDYLRDIALAEKVKYILTSTFDLVKISDVLDELIDRTNQADNVELPSRDISSNVTHPGKIDDMQHIRFTAMRIAVVTCKVKPPSSDSHFELDRLSPTDTSYPSSIVNRNNGITRSLSTTDDFLREMAQLLNCHGKSKQEAMEALESLPDHIPRAQMLSPTTSSQMVNLTTTTSDVKPNNQFFLNTSSFAS
uniref:Protein kinase domain-containing protein n=1 Tax=Steinernema glaseri TaxID=37863 RepID=A0A1I7YZF3_9BILA